MAYGKKCRKDGRRFTVGELQNAAHYARQANDRDMEVKAAEIRIRAERRLGEMLREQRERGLMATGGDAMRARYQNGTEVPPTLADVGIDKKLSSRAQQIAAIPEPEFEADVLQGTRRDAEWYSFGANKNHGLRRQKGDAKRAIEKILLDEEWSTKSLEVIAQHVGVSQPYVSQVKKQLISTYELPKRDVTIGVDGRTRNTTNIGHAQKPEPRREFEIVEPEKPEPLVNIGDIDPL